MGTINIVVGGIVLAVIVFMFAFVASKKKGKFYLAPVFTFLLAVAITAYGLFVVRGFEGMAYGFIGVGFLIVSIVGTLFLPVLVRRKGSEQFKKKDRVTLVILPIIFFTIIGLNIYFDEVYWIVDQGEITYKEEVRRDGLENYYEVSTISEGRKQVELMLGKEYSGKEIVVENVTKRGPTEITVNIVEGEVTDKVPFIIIGLDEIKEPLTVQILDGVVIESVMDQLEK